MLEKENNKFNESPNFNRSQFVDLKSEAQEKFPAQANRMNISEGVKLLCKKMLEEQEQNIKLES